MTRTPTVGRLQARAKSAAAKRAAARVVVSQPAAATEDADSPDDSPAQAATSAELWLYGTVGGYWWGFNSDDVADALRDLGDVDEILVRLHSFGGSAIEGIAITNLLANHPAEIRVVVDGIAASAASMIALSGTELTMSPGSQLMIHDVWTFAAGNAADLRSEADWLDKQSRNYAETYAARAGGTAETWREAMTANNGDGTWYTAQEAVDAGLADRVANIASSTPPPAMPDPDDVEESFAAAAAYDLDTLIHPAARAAWSTWRREAAPKPPTASAGGSITAPKEAAMAFTPEQLTTMRQELGLAETADEATIVAALSEALAEQPEAPAAPTVPEGMSLVDNTVLDQLRAGAEDGRQAREQQRVEARNAAIQAAVESGRIAPASREHFAQLYDADPEGTGELLANLAPGLVPVNEIGHSGDLQPKAAGDATYDSLFGSEQKGA